MPIVAGFHPYYQIPGVPRDQYVAHIPARTRVLYDDRLIPTGKFAPMDLTDEFPLRGLTLDNGFMDLAYGADKRAHFYIKAGTSTVEASFGPKYTNAVVWLPNQEGKPQAFICFEPMTGIVNAPTWATARMRPCKRSPPAHVGARAFGSRPPESKSFLPTASPNPAPANTGCPQHKPRH